MERTQKIDSPQNPLIKATAKLRNRSFRQESGRIIIDGEREVGRAIESGLVIESLFFSEHFSLEKIPDCAAQKYQLSDRALARIAYGDRAELVAVAHVPSRQLDEIAVHEDSVFVVLDQVEKPGNIGAVLRSCDGAGIDAVMWIDPCTDLYNPNAIRASLGTIFSLPYLQVGFEEFRLWSTRHQVLTYLAICDETAESYERISFRTPCSLVFGSEAMGLGSRWGTLGHSRNVTLPMRGSADSLNVSAATAVLSYEVVRQIKSKQNQS